MLVRSICSDFYKWKRTPILWLHIIMPLAGAFAFLWYFSITGNNNPLRKISVFLEVLCIVFPLLIGLLCGMTAAQEEQAGNYQVILSGTKSRTIAYMSKVLLLLLLSAFSVALAIGVFAVGFYDAPRQIYIRASLAAWGGSIFLYILHLFISFRFGHGASIGLGVFGTLISALMLTGLGDRIWHWIPWGWSERLCDDLIFIVQNPYETVLAATDMQYGILVCFFVTFLSLVASLLWFRHWEGFRSNE